MTSRPDLDRSLEAILVDAYGEDEQYTAFLTVIEDETPLPDAATLLGTRVTVRAFDYTDPVRGLVPPQTVTAWIHAAYRYHLGLTPFPAEPRPYRTWPG
jgi:hypothetical protein